VENIYFPCVSKDLEGVQKVFSVVTKSEGLVLLPEAGHFGSNEMDVMPFLYKRNSHLVDTNTSVTGDHYYV
jgi:hypothetical protein